MPESPMMTFRIDATNPTRPKILLDGSDVSDSVRDWFISGRSGELPELTLVSAGPTDICGLAAVTVVTEATTGDALLQLCDAVIDGLDAAAIEQAALDGLGWGDDEHSTTQAILAAVKQAIHDSALVDG